MAGLKLLRQSQWGKSYTQKLRAQMGGRLIAYWPLGEQSGSVALDVSGNGRNGSYTNVSLGQTGIGDGRRAAAFAGNGYVNIYSASLAGAFNGNEYTIFLWAQNANWQSADNNILFVIANVAVNCWSYIQKNGPNIDFGRHASGVTKINEIKWPVTTNYLCLACVVSKAGDYQRLYCNGVLYDQQTGLEAWTGGGSLNTANSVIAAWSTIPSGPPYVGKLAHVGIVNGVITDSEADQIYQKVIYPTRLTVLGDSISGWPNAVVNWVSIVAATYHSGWVEVRNHAVGGHSIIANMAGQTTASASDGANKIIIELGTNDNDAGNMTTLQAEVETRIAALKVSNPSAVLYYLNVMPLWTDSGGGTPVAKGNIRTAVAAACTAQGITCWDTFNTPWIVAADTSDGTHPTAAGYAKVATEVLARI